MPRHLTAVMGWGGPTRICWPPVGVMEPTRVTLPAV